MSSCSLNGSVAELLLPLAATPITRLSAADCGLHGELPALNALAVRVDGSRWEAWSSTLGEALQELDLSKNSIARLHSPPAGLRLLSLGHNAIPMTIDNVALAEAIRSRLDLNLQGTELANREEVRRLLGKELETTQSRPGAVSKRTVYTWQNCAGTHGSVSREIGLKLPFAWRLQSKGSGSILQVSK